MQRHFDFVLLGGGPASVSAAETLRAEGAKGSILLVSEEDDVPYGHSHLSKRFLLGAQPKEKLLIHSEAYYRDHAIELMLGTLAVAIDTTNRLVRTDRGGHPFREVADRNGGKTNSPDRSGRHASRCQLPAHFGGC
jgi:NADPH-dependent 2,4-dienoyl-CoA reductase/sulfur reductase-like enzyme